MLINGAGAVTTAAVTIIVMSTKFLAGAWIVLLLIPFLVANFYAIHRHYTLARKELSIDHLPQPHHRPQHILVPVGWMSRATAAALDYAISISSDVTAVHFAFDDEEAEDFQRRWKQWANDAPLLLVPSPFREVVSPLVDLVDSYCREKPDNSVTVVLPEVVPHHLYEAPLHNQMEIAIRLALYRRPGVVVTTVPVRLRE